MSYSQFIHGKVVGERNYKIIALTRDLVGRESELENIAQQYRFWGQQPPETNPIAVGVFQYGDGLLLAQAMSAIYGDGRHALDGQGRPFSQHRYVFLPADSISHIAGRLWLLLDWVMAETRGIPVFKDMTANLRPLPPYVYDVNLVDGPAEREKLSRSLQLMDDTGQRLVLSSLASLVQGKRVVLDAADRDGILSEDLLEGLLLLLPAVCRSQVSIAAGAIDETICTQASLIVKTNGAPAAPLAADVVWVKRATNQLYGLSNKEQRLNDYTTLLNHILAQPDSLAVLQRILDTVDDTPPPGYSSVWQALNNGWLATQLIPALPDPSEREKYWRTTLKALSPAEWQTILPAVVDEIGLEIAWAELQKAVKRDPERYTALIFRLWQNFSEAYISYALEEEIPADPVLAEILLRNGLMTHFEEPHHTQVNELALRVVGIKANENYQAGLALAQTLLEAREATSVVDRLRFLEATLGDELDEASCRLFFNEALVPLLPDLSLDVWHKSRIYQPLRHVFPQATEVVDTIIKRQKKGLVLLPELAAEMGMTLNEVSNLYVHTLGQWPANAEQARSLLANLLLFWAEHDVEDRPALFSLMTPLIKVLDTTVSPSLAACLTVSNVTLTIEEALPLADYLFDDAWAHVQFVDATTAGVPCLPVCQQWLLVVAGDRERLDSFEQSYTWRHIQAAEPTWLAEAISQILGWQETPLSALLPIVERLQSALDLPQTAIFQLLESRPRQGDSSLGMILGAYLPALSNAELTADEAVEAQPLWQMLQAQAPKVAQVYKVLAEGQHNVALDLFNQRKLNAALNEAPEYAEAMAQWLQLCGKGNWISGRLIESIIHRWLANPAQIDVALLRDLLQPDLARQYQVADWIALAQICWQTDYQVLWPISGQPDLNPRQQSQVLSIAMACIKTYGSIQAVQHLLTACRNWGLDREHLSQLVAQVPAAACSFRLLSPFLQENGTDKETDIGLLQLAMSMSSEDVLEQAAFKTFLTNLTRQHLCHEDGIPFLVNGYQVAKDKDLYEAAMADAVGQVAGEQFSLLVKRAHQFKQQGCLHLSQTMLTALDHYWHEEKHNLQRVNDEKNA